MFRIPPAFDRTAAGVLLGAFLLAPAARAADAPLAPAIAKLTGFVVASYDSSRGGFVTRDRTPNESAIELAWRLGRDDDAWRGRARRSVEWTWSLYDSVGGGFLQSERDARHDVASFEKRTDANAWRLENRIDAWLDARRHGSGDADRRVILQVVDFFERVLLDGRGGFVAGQVGDRDMIPEANGPAIHAYLRWAVASGESRWRDFAAKSLDRLWAENWNADLGFIRKGEMGQATALPRLDDQVEMGRAFVFAREIGGRDSDLAHARAIGDLLFTLYEDRKLGGMRAQVALTKEGKVKGAARDPESNARAARFLAELAAASGDARYREGARRLVDQFVPSRNRAAVDDADWVLAMWTIERPDRIEKAVWKAPEKAPPPAPRVIRAGKVRR